MYYILTDYSDEYLTADTYEQAKVSLESLVSEDTVDKGKSVTGFIFRKPLVKVYSVVNQLHLVYDIDNGSEVS